MLIPTLRVVALSLGVLSCSLWGQTLETLYSFPADSLDGRYPEATLTFGPDGLFYGTATEGGVTKTPTDNGDGTIFSVSLQGEVTIIDDFEKTTTGRNPFARLLNIGDGYLYGVTSRNGNTAGDPVGTVYQFDPQNGLSVVFQLDAATGALPSNPRALVSGEPNVLHVLGYEPGGLWRVPLGEEPAEIVDLFDPNNRQMEGSFHNSLIRGSDGFLYGTSFAGGDAQLGMIFRIAPDGTGITRLHSCVNATGVQPDGAMVEGPDGNFYGTMEDRGELNGEFYNGVIFRITPAGEYTVIHYLDDFRYPNGDLLLASDGFFYGTAKELGTGGNGNGGVFRIRPDGSDYEVVYVFEDTNTEPFYPNGRTPVGGLVQGADGFLYGTTRRGGDGDSGTIFRIDLGLPKNKPPVAIDDFAVSTGAAVTVNVKSNDFDADGETLTVTIESDPEFGTVEVLAGGSIRYTPDENYNGFDSFEYRVSDPRGGIAVAKVTIQNTPPQPVLVEGKYLGLLKEYETEDPRGTFTLKVEETGRFTGSLILRKKRASFRGTFEDNGTAIVELKLPKREKAVLFLAFQGGSTATVVGAVFSTEACTGAAGQNVLSNSEKKQSYTVQIVSDDGNLTVPAGHGYGVVTIKPNGAVSMIGKLGDGSNLSLSTTLIKLPGFARVIPFFDEPTKGGVFAGHTVPTVNGFEGDARWVRPPARKDTLPYHEGFRGDVVVSVTPFTAPEKTDPVFNIPNGTVVLSGGPVATTSGTFEVDGKKITADGNLRSLSINRKNGLFTGKMLVGNKTLVFKGAINQGGGTGAGFVSIKGETGSVELFRPID